MLLTLALWSSIGFAELHLPSDQDCGETAASAFSIEEELEAVERSLEERNAYRTTKLDTGRRQQLENDIILFKAKRALLELGGPIHAYSQLLKMGTAPAEGFGKLVPFMVAGLELHVASLALAIDQVEIIHSEVATANETVREIDHTGLLLKLENIYFEIDNSPLDQNLRECWRRARDLKRSKVAARLRDLRSLILAEEEVSEAIDRATLNQERWVNRARRLLDDLQKIVIIASSFRSLAPLPTGPDLGQPIE